MEKRFGVGLLLFALFAGITFVIPSENTSVVKTRDETVVKREAYATYVYGNVEDTHLEMCRFWVLRLQSFNVTRSIVMLFIGESFVHAPKFAQLGVHVVKAEPLSNPHSMNPDTFNKLRLWELDQYDKIVYMDPDLFVLTSEVERLFDYEPFAATKDFIDPPSYPDYPYFGFNAGLFVFQPSRAELGFMIGNFSICPWLFERGLVRTEQEYLNWYFLNTWHFISPRFGLSIYTIRSTNLDVHLVPHSVTENTVSIHLFCKPWWGHCTDKGNIRTDYRQVFEQFWRVYDKLLPNGMWKGKFRE